MYRARLHKNVFDASFEDVLKHYKIEIAKKSTKSVFSFHLKEGKSRWLKMSELLELHQLVESEGGIHRGRRSKAYDFMSNCYSCPFLGILLATLSSFFFSLCSVIVKELVDINPIELASFR